jgi:hypothetical protein
MKWLLTLTIAVLVIGIFLPHAARLFGIGRLPGDVTLRWRRHTYRFPFGSTLIMCGLLWLLGRLL